MTFFTNEYKIVVVTRLSAEAYKQLDDLGYTIVFVGVSYSNMQH